jgi:hypothetical protein
MDLATFIQPQIKQQIESLYQAFLRCQSAEQINLMILAVVYKPIGVAKLKQLIDILNNRGFLPKAKNHYHLSLQQRDQLIKQSLLISCKNGLQVNKLLANRLITNIAQLNISFEDAAQKYTADEKLTEIMMATEEVIQISSGNSWQKQ